MTSLEQARYLLIERMNAHLHQPRPEGPTMTVKRFNAAHKEWVESQYALSQADDAAIKAHQRFEKAKGEMDAARVALVTAVLDRRVVDT